MTTLQRDLKNEPSAETLNEWDRTHQLHPWAAMDAWQESDYHPIERAEGIYLYDRDGNAYLDGSSGAMVSNIGHSNPNVLAAMKRQMDKATFGYRLQFETEASENLAAKLATLCPDGLNKVFFVSGGSEAVESAMKLARQHALATGQGEDGGMAA